MTISSGISGKSKAKTDHRQTTPPRTPQSSIYDPAPPSLTFQQVLEGKYSQALLAFLEMLTDQFHFIHLGIRQTHTGMNDITRILEISIEERLIDPQNSNHSGY